MTNLQCDARQENKYVRRRGAWAHTPPFPRVSLHTKLPQPRPLCGSCEFNASPTGLVAQPQLNASLRGGFHVRSKHHLVATRCHYIGNDSIDVDGEVDASTHPWQLAASKLTLG